MRTLVELDAHEGAVVPELVSIHLNDGDEDVNRPSALRVLSPFDRKSIAIVLVLSQIDANNLAFMRTFSSVDESSTTFMRAFFRFERHKTAVMPALSSVDANSLASMPTLPFTERNKMALVRTFLSIEPHETAVMQTLLSLEPNNLSFVPTLPCIEPDDLFVQAVIGRKVRLRVLFDVKSRPKRSTYPPVDRLFLDAQPSLGDELANQHDAGPVFAHASRHKLRFLR